ncbi:calcium-binding protein [Lithospermum erythrorhizon]|uniref:Calcium-binding protein n=1 Tax=Lithospermum erythrorhizon TaxID=34254 RepID=A0AAV3NJE2_LITER
MGGKHSTRRKISKLFGSSASSSHEENIYGFPPPSPYTQYRPYYTPQHPLAGPTPPVEYHYGARTPPPQWLDRRYSRIEDNYQTLDQVTTALAEAGLESSNLIVGIDFTKSNEWTGTSNIYNWETLAAFDEDNLIPCFGFGDASTHDTDVFSFFPGGTYCNGFAEVLRRYRELVPHLYLSGPTSFAPMIEMAMTIVEESGGQYHVLLIIADGQVTRSSETPYGQLSLQEQKTVDAIVKASEYPLSIIVVGVGDGPWDMMKDFDDNIPARAFDNFQFVNFTELMSKRASRMRKESEFALAALMEIPPQYQATIALNILGNKTGTTPGRIPLPPPICTSMSYHSTSLQRHPSRYPAPGEHGETFSYSTSQYDNQICVICLNNLKNLAFGCGHQTCEECGENLSQCPICRSAILTKIKLYA